SIAIVEPPSGTGRLPVIADHSSNASFDGKPPPAASAPNPASRYRFPEVPISPTGTRMNMSPDPLPVFEVISTLTEPGVPLLRSKLGVPVFTSFIRSLALVNGAPVVTKILNVINEIGSFPD